MSVEEYVRHGLADAVLESSGKFSVDFLKARDKLEQFRLPSPAHYLLKVVQAAVLSGAPEVRIEVHAQATVARFCPQDEQLQQFSSVTEGLGNPLEVANPALRSLCQALLGAMLNRHEAVCWRVNHPQGSDVLRLGATGNSTECWRYRARPPVEGLLTQFRPPNWRFWISARDRAEEGLLLQQKGGFCPIPLRFDGLGMQNYWPQIPAGRGEHPFFLYQMFWPGSDFGIKPPALASFFREGPRWVWRVVHWHPGGVMFSPAAIGQTCFFFEVQDRESWGEVVGCRAAAAVDSRFEPEATCIFVDHGVALEPVRLDLGLPGLWLILPRGNLDLDLSGFRIIENEKLRARIDDMKHLARQIQQRVQEQRRRFGPLYQMDGVYVESAGDVRVTEFHRKLAHFCSSKV